MSIGSIFHAVTSKVHEILVSLFGQPALDKVDTDVKKLLSDDFRPIFLEAIQAVAAYPGSGPDKRGLAFSKIADELKAQGKALPEQLINLGIELVLGLVKAKTA